MVSRGEVEEDLLDFGFNQDASGFACSTSTGFRIFSCEPFRNQVGFVARQMSFFESGCVQFRRDFDTGGIGIVQMLFRCNILAICGGGMTPRFPPTNVGVESN